jgi:hypothetical protein
MELQPRMAKQSRMDSGRESVYTETGGSHIIDLLTHVKQCKTENRLINHVLLYLFVSNPAKD